MRSGARSFVLPPLFNDRVRNVSRGHVDRFVFPDSDHQPARFTESAVCVRIPRTVFLDLGPPPAGVAFRAPTMIRTSVPKAPVHEDGDLLATEDDVGLTPQIRERPDVNAIAKPTTMEFGSKDPLRRRVARPLRDHSPTRIF
jgi:hypothetical protein